MLLLLLSVCPVQSKKTEKWGLHGHLKVLLLLCCCCLFVWGEGKRLCLSVFVVVAGNDDVDDDMEGVREEHSWRRWSLTMLMKRR